MQSCGVHLIESIVVGSWNPNLTSLDARDLSVVSIILVDFWLPLFITLLRLTSLLLLLIRLSGYLAPFVRLLSTWSQKGLFCRKRCKISVVLTRSHS